MLPLNCLQRQCYPFFFSEVSYLHFSTERQDLEAINQKIVFHSKWEYDLSKHFRKPLVGYTKQISNVVVEKIFLKIRNNFSACLRSGFWRREMKDCQMKIKTFACNILFGRKLHITHSRQTKFHIFLPLRFEQ